MATLVRLSIHWSLATPYLAVSSKACHQRCALLFTWSWDLLSSCFLDGTCGSSQPSDCSPCFGKCSFHLGFSHAGKHVSPAHYIFSFMMSGWHQEHFEGCLVEPYHWQQELLQRAFYYHSFGTTRSSHAVHYMCDLPAFTRQ